jgi:hypothetical protein
MHLSLHDTGVTGSVAELAPLTQLVVLSLHDTGVHGDAKCLRDRVPGLSDWGSSSYDFGGTDVTVGDGSRCDEVEERDEGLPESAAVVIIVLVVLLAVAVAVAVAKKQRRSKLDRTPPIDKPALETVAMVPPEDLPPARAPAGQQEQKRRQKQQRQDVVVTQFQATCSVDAEKTRGCLRAAGGDLPAAIGHMVEEERLRQQSRTGEQQAVEVAEFMRQRYTDEATARDQLQQTGWDLRRALASYMPPVPDSPVAGRTFAGSHFKAAYKQVSVPEGPMDLGMKLGDLIRAYCRQEAIEWEAEGEPFLKKLQREAMHNMDDPIEQMLQRMWTSTLTLRNREFCSILNCIARADEQALATALAGLARGINRLCVSVPPRPPFPQGDTCYRGGGFDDRYRSFFVSGRQFRQPAYLATSFSEDVARRFIGMRGADRCVLWRVRIDAVRKCMHVNLVTRRVPGLPDEQEYLFAPYSAFSVLSATWNAGTVANPHVIELLAAVDNRTEPEDLPLAPWS